MIATNILTIRLRERLEAWDQGSASQRVVILEKFLEEFEVSGCYDMDDRLDYGSSVLLARFLVWLKVSYMEDPRSIITLFKVLKVFTCSLDGDRYLTEMIDGDLLTTLLDVLLKQKFKAAEKLGAMELLNKIALRGRRYKEAICESGGVKILCEFIDVNSLNSDDKSIELEESNDSLDMITADTSISVGELNSEGDLGEKDCIAEIKDDTENAIPVNVLVTESQHEKLQLLEDFIQCQEKPTPMEQMKTEENQDEKPCSLLEVVQTESNPRVQNQKADESESVSLLDLDNSQELLQKARELLVNVAIGNPSYQVQLARELLQLMTSDNTFAQIVACEVIRNILPVTMDLCGEVIKPLLGMLGKEDTSLLYETLQLVDIVVTSKWKTELFKQLIMLIGDHPLDNPVAESDISVDQLSPPNKHRVQADAILAIDHALSECTVTELMMLEAEVVLVAALGSTVHQESQRRAAQVLRRLVQLAPSMETILKEHFPPGLLQRLIVDPIEAANSLTAAEAKCLTMWGRTQRDPEAIASC